MGRFSGKSVVVTGGSGGMGFAVAKLMSEGGARVAITGRSAATLDAARAQLGEGAVAIRGDVSVLSDLDALAERVTSELGTLDALFVNAGLTRAMPFEATTEAMYDELFAVNVKGAYFSVQKLAPLLSPGAGVVLTTSAAHVIGISGVSVYAAGKAALRSLARSFSRELLPREIRVNAISPGPIDTGTLEGTMTPEEAEQFTAERIADTPMGRFGTTEEFAAAAAFLAVDATYTTGAELALDGGVSQL